MNPFSLGENGGCELSRETRARSEGRTEPGRGATTAILVGNDQEANPTARGQKGSFHASVPPQLARNGTCGLKRSHFPGGLRILKPFNRQKQMRLYIDLQVSRPPHMGQSWVGWVGLKTQARFPRGVVLEPKWRQHIRARISRVHVCLKLC